MTSHLTRLLAAAAIAVTGLGAAGLAGGQQPQNFDDVRIRILPVRDNVFMLLGDGGNITVQTGEDGVLIVDTQYARLSDRILAAIRTLSDGPIRYLINTHYHGDHTGGNENLRRAGSTIAGGNVTLDIADAAVGAQILAHDNVLRRLSSPPAGRAAAPVGAWPTSTL